MAVKVLTGLAPQQEIASGCASLAVFGVSTRLSRPAEGGIVLLLVVSRTVSMGAMRPRASLQVAPAPWFKIPQAKFPATQMHIRAAISFGRYSLLAVNDKVDV